MDYENAYDDGSKRRTTIIVAVVAVVVLAGLGVIAVLVLRNRSAAGNVSGTNGQGGTAQEVQVPAAEFQFQQVSDPEASVGGSATKADTPPSKDSMPQPGVDRLLTDEEKKNYGYPVEWKVRMRTSKGSLGLQTDIIVEDKGNWQLPSGNKEKVQETTPPPATTETAPQATNAPAPTK